MARRKPDPGAIYVSPRLQASLEPMGRCALTTVTAPMGYGKTTAVNWFLAAQPPGSAIRVSIYSDSLPALWESGRRAFRAAGLTVLEGFDCPMDPAATGLLVDTLCRELRRPEPWYLFADDLHLLPDPRMARFLCELAARLPENVHLIAASRDRILSGDQVLRLGGRLHRIGAEQLRLEGGELAAYVHRCGAALDQELRVRHIAVKDKAELPRLQGAKPVQSDLGDSFRRVRHYLDQGRRVLFSDPLSGGRPVSLLRRASGAAADLRRGVQRRVLPGGVGPTGAVYGVYQAAAAGGRVLLRQAARGKGPAIPCPLRRRRPV